MERALYKVEILFHRKWTICWVLYRKCHGLSFEPVGMRSIRDAVCHSPGKQYRAKI